MHDRAVGSLVIGWYLLYQSTHLQVISRRTHARSPLRAMASPPAAAAPEISEQLMAELSNLNDESFDRLLRCAIDNTFQLPQDGASVAIPLTISSSSHVSVSDGSAVADAIVVHSSTGAIDQPASVVEEYTIPQQQEF